MKLFIASCWYHSCRTLCGIFAKICFGLKLYDSQNVPKKGATLLLCNHQSFLDPIFCQSLILRTFRFIARDTLWSNPIFGWLLTSYRIVPIKRGQADLSAMKTVINILKQNDAVCMFPEATRTDDGKIKDIKPGFSLMVRRTGACVVPVVIEGAFEAWPRTEKKPRFGRPVRVIYGQPITAETVKKVGDDAFSKLLTGKMRSLQNTLREKMGREPFDYDIPDLSELEKSKEDAVLIEK